MKLNKTTILTLIIAIAAAKGWCQQGGSFIPASLSLVPPSPDVAALNKYIDVPVNFYTGVPSINLPIYSIKAGNRSIPISLSYHAGGIKTTEQSGWVGLGWTLNAGSNISRSMSGLPDETPGTGYLNLPEVPELNSPLYYQSGAYPVNYQPSHTQVIGFANGNLDGEPDLFYFSAGSKSGKFVLDKTTGQPQLITHEKIKITYTPGFTSWTVVTPDGVVYYYDQTEQSHTQNAVHRGAAKTYTSAWQLTRISYPGSADTVKFYYSSYTSTYKQGFSQTAYHPFAVYTLAFSNPNNPGSSCVSAFGGDMPVQTSQNLTTVTGKYLSRIDFTAGSLVFNTSGAGDPVRYDVTGSRYLKNIQLRNRAGAVLQQYNFHYAYFNSNGTTPLSGSYSGQSQENLRLKLTRLEKTAAGLTEDYGFDYNATPLPEKFSTSADHWGYYNGRPNGSLLPETWVSWLGDQYIPGANRNADNQYMQAAVLNKITYPTGGSSEYFFEANDCEHMSLPDNKASRSIDKTAANINTAQNFSISLIGRPVTQLQLAPVQVPANSRLTVKITPPAGNTIEYEWSALHGNTPDISPVYAGLRNGVYLLECDFVNYGTPVPAQENIIRFFWEDDVLTHKKPAGGLRVKRIKMNDPVTGGALIKDYGYTTNFGDSVSSGQLLSFPVYDYFYKDKTTSYVALTSLPNNELTYTQGSPVGYSRVVVSQVNAAGAKNGVSEYFFTSQKDYPDYFNAQVVTPFNPYLPAVSGNAVTTAPAFPFTTAAETNEWRRGLLTKQVDYKTAGTLLTPLKKTENIYTYFAAPVSAPNGDSVSPFAAFVTCSKAFTGHTDSVIQVNPNTCTPSATLTGYGSKVYKIFTGMFAELNSTKETLYDDNGTALESQTSFTYDRSTHNTRTISVAGSDGRVKQSSFTYTADQSADPTGVFAAMAARNMYSPLVEQEQRVNGQFLTKEVTGYSLNTGSGLLHPKSLSVQNAGGPLRTKVQYLQYNASGHLTEAAKENDVHLAFIHDENDYLTAEAVNASPLDIGFTSFETDSKGNFDYTGSGIAADAAAPTGRNSYQLAAGPVTKTVQPGVTYIVSCWKTGSLTLPGATLYRTGRTINGYTYVEYQLSGTALLSLGGTGNIDALRLHPKNAQMTSYTYDPLIGMTSQADVNGNIIYYEYDAFGRVKLIRDMDRNVVKVMDYQYQKGITE